ncbi:hypothetical protein QMP26_10515 [Enterocloster clostridioformis]
MQTAKDFPLIFNPLQIPTGEATLPLRWLPPATPLLDLPPGNTLRCKLFPVSKFYKSPLYSLVWMKYNEVSDKSKLNKIAARWPAKAVA